MSALGSKLRTVEGGLVAFWCPGCDEAHNLRVRINGTPSPSWDFNGDGDKPTFRPSVLVTGTERLSEEEHAAVMRGEHFEPIKVVCHSFITDGTIQFLNDCTHALAGQTVPLPDWPQ
jgi:hypothetical protein